MYLKSNSSKFVHTKLYLRREESRITIANNSDNVALAKELPSLYMNDDQSKEQF
jgi:hypothetical protein